MIAILLYCLLIFIMTFVLMGTAFIIAIRLGMFDMKDNPDSMSWEDFKKEIKKLFNAQE